MKDVIRNITYFPYCGEVNTQYVLQLARERADELGIGKVVIASETGRSALKALEIFRGSDAQLIVVTHYPATTIGPKGRIPIGLKRSEYASRLETLLENNVKIVQGTRPLAPPSRSIQWNAPTPEGMMDKTLEIFGAGTKIAIEASIMATDAGEVEEGEEIVSCAGTFKGLDTALIARATYSMNFFKEFEIHEIIARPRCRVRKLPEYEFENWKGDVEQYYG
ncbi:MAG: hypothetical protein JW963_17930 [Anaerolineales bacterium]|nr:hypothetical protein [Anaerolineales bacterium]